LQLRRNEIRKKPLKEWLNNKAQNVIMPYRNNPYHLRPKRLLAKHCWTNIKVFVEKTIVQELENEILGPLSINAFFREKAKNYVSYVTMC
jgi:hypothetical protein